MIPRLFLRLFFAPALIAALLLLAALQASPARARRPAQDAAPQPSATLEEEGASTPALLLTPLPTGSGDAQPARPGAVWATAALFMCTMIAMLFGGIGLAVVFYRLRLRLRR